MSKFIEVTPVKRVSSEFADTDYVAGRKLLINMDYVAEISESCISYKMPDDTFCYLYVHETYDELKRLVL